MSMIPKKISELPVATDLTGAIGVVVDNTGQTKQAAWPQSILSSDDLADLQKTVGDLRTKTLFVVKLEDYNDPDLGETYLCSNFAEFMQYAESATDDNNTTKNLSVIVDIGSGSRCYAIAQVVTTNDSTTVALVYDDITKINYYTLSYYIVGFMYTGAVPVQLSAFTIQTLGYRPNTPTISATTGIISQSVIGLMQMGSLGLHAPGGFELKKADTASGYQLSGLLDGLKNAGTIVFDSVVSQCYIRIYKDEDLLPTATIRAEVQVQNDSAVLGNVIVKIRTLPSLAQGVSLTTVSLPRIGYPDVVDVDTIEFIDPV